MEWYHLPISLVHQCCLVYIKIHCNMSMVFWFRQNDLLNLDRFNVFQRVTIVNQLTTMKSLNLCCHLNSVTAMNVALTKL